MTLRPIIVLILGLLPVLALAACGRASDAGSVDDPDAPVVIALLPPKTGALAQYGTDAVKGWESAVEMVNAAGGVDGREVELVVKDTDGSPATTLRVAREAVSKDGAKFIGGIITSPETSALAAQLDTLGALVLNSSAKDDALREGQCASRAFHIVQSYGMDINALAESLKELPGERWAIQAVDYSTGHTAADVFRKAVEEAGKEVVLEQFAPLGTTDFGSYITQIKGSGADALFAVEQGADGIAFVQQAAQFGLREELKTVLGANMVTKPLFEPMGETVVGYYGNVGYDVGADNALNQDFVEAYGEEYGTAPYYLPADNYLAAQALFAAIEKAKSVDPDDVGEALEGLTFDSILGKVTMRAEDHQLLRPSNLGRVVADGDDLAFEIVASEGAASTTAQASPACQL